MDSTFEYDDDMVKFYSICKAIEARLKVANMAIEREERKQKQKEPEEETEMEEENESLNEMERLEKEQLEKERLIKERRLEKERLEKERLDKEQLEKEQRFARKLLQRKQLEKERHLELRQEQERLEKERLEKERRLDKERLDKERLDKVRLDKERLDKEKERHKKQKEIWLDKEKEEEEEEVNETKSKRRSSFVSDLKGSVYVKRDFPMDKLPLALRKFQIYGVRDANLGGQEGSFWMSAYVVKKLVDNEFELSSKTIDNYFRTNSSHSQVGYVVNSKRIPIEGENNPRLSSSHKYTLIKLHFLKEWWEKSYTMHRIIQRTGKNAWPSETLSDDEVSDLSDGNDDDDDDDDKMEID